MIIIFISIYFGQSLAFVKNEEFLCSETSTTKPRNFLCIVNKTYDTYAVPIPMPMIVDSEIRIHDVTNIDEIGHSITVYMDLSATWSDEGLKMLGNNGSK